ncbi:hypothetical protein RUM44_013086 [Polyplax serrata]|uniref:DNA-directed RNA polymerase III subunit n=1 Tax=Polyplax serrata TaxID=468196 RepID=A0ABR1BDG7_POLSC
MSFDYNQLGFGGGETLPAPVLQPPPTFPFLEHKPIPLIIGPENDYMVALKRDFVEYFHSVRQNNSTLSGIERFSDKYQVLGSDMKESWDSQVYWDAMPVELNTKGRKTGKRKPETGSISYLKKTKIDISTRLDELAKLEDIEEDESDGIKEEKEQDDDNEKENFEEEDDDDEMDDGTDYVNNYFDNGESYFDDEDDNLDDGPVY